MHLQRRLKFENTVIMEFVDTNTSNSIYYRIDIDKDSPSKDVLDNFSFDHITLLRLATTCIHLPDQRRINIIKDRYDDISCVVRCLMAEHTMIDLDGPMPDPFQQMATQQRERELFTHNRAMILMNQPIGVIDLDVKS